MENCKANNVPEKRFLQKLLEIGKLLLCKKHLYKDLSNSCSVDLVDIKNNLPKQEICSKI